MHKLLMLPCKTNKWQMREQAVKITAKIFHASYFPMARKQQTDASRASRIYENSEGRKHTIRHFSPSFTPILVLSNTFFFCFYVIYYFYY